MEGTEGMQEWNDDKRERTFYAIHIARFCLTRHQKTLCVLSSLSYYLLLLNRSAVA